MSSTKFNNYVYVSNKSTRVLAIRRSRDYDLSFDSPDFKCYTITSDAPLFLKDPFLFQYDLMRGFTEAVEANPDEHDQLLQKKVEILSAIKLNVEMVQQRIRSNLNRKYVRTMNLDASLVHRVERLIARERSLGVKRSRVLFSDFQKAVERATSLESIHLAYDHLKYNCNIGSYAKIGERF